MYNSSKDSKLKIGVKSSVADKVKALEGDSRDLKKGDKSSKSTHVEGPPPPPPIVDQSSIKKSSSSKDKDNDKKDKKSSLKVKDKAPSPPSADYRDLPIRDRSSPLPGGFPTDEYPNDKMPPSDKKSTKDKHSSKPATTKTDKHSSKTKMRDVEILPPTPPLDDELIDLAEKKKSRSKDHDHAKDRHHSSDKSKAEKPLLSRSKSERKPSERDIADRERKSSDSDKAGRSDRKERPSTSRRMSLSGMFGSAPSRSKSVKHPTSSTPKSSSKRHSVDVADLSPPKDVSARKITGKAAAVLGAGRPSVGRRDSKMERRKSHGVPDPYAIDDDDVVVVDTPTHDLGGHKHGKDRHKEQSTKSKSKRESVYMSGALDADDDAVLVDGQQAKNGRNADKELDGHAVDRSARPPLKRSNTSTKRASGLKSFFGSFKQPRESDGHVRSRSYDSDDARTGRKRGVGEDADASMRLRRENRRVDRSRRTTEVDGQTDAAPGTSATEAEDVERRRAERRARRAEREAAESVEADKRETERKERRMVRETRRREEKEARETQRSEERRKRRAEREASHAAEEQERKKSETRDAERRARRREEEKSSRPGTDRRRSHVDHVDQKINADDANRHDKHRLRRSTANHDLTSKDRPHASRRQTEHPPDVKPVEGDGDYFSHRPKQSSANKNGGNCVYPSSVKGGADKTSSWVASVNEEPPPPPPAVQTVVDERPKLGDDAAATKDDERRAKKRHSTTAEEQQQDRRRRGAGKEERRREREREPRSDGDSNNSGENPAVRRRSTAYNSLGYEDMSPKAGLDARPTMGGKRNSLFGGLKKMAGF